MPELVQGVPSALAAEIQNTARFVMASLRALPTPRDSATALALAHTAIIWTQRPESEAEVRKLMADMTEVVVTMWKAQERALLAGSRANHGR